jgi:hypothetical protein
MVSCCVNPACRTEFKLLNAGDLYAHEQPDANTEFFWLCAACCSKFELQLDADGGVSVRPRSYLAGSHPPHPAGHLHIVTRPIGRKLWRHAIPSGERTPPPSGFGWS